jgi:RNA polymerase sigma factor (sigma-70 family)
MAGAASETLNRVECTDGHHERMMACPVQEHANICAGYPASAREPDSPSSLGGTIPHARRKQEAEPSLLPEGIADCREPFAVCRTLQVMSDDDASDWVRVRAGDAAALGALFDRHETRLFRHACRLLTSREDAKDAVMIAFFELWRKRYAVRLVDGSPLPWLLNTVSYAARNLERSGRRYRALIARAPRPDNVREATGGDESGVLAALKRLPAKEQSVIVLTVLEGYPERAAAETLGIPVGTVKSRLARARAKLRDEITGMETS